MPVSLLLALCVVLSYLLVGHIALRRLDARLDFTTGREDELFPGFTLAVWPLILWSFTERPLDPMEVCEVVHEVGCCHVDGMLCDPRACSIRDAYARSK